MSESVKVSFRMQNVAEKVFWNGRFHHLNFALFRCKKLHKAGIHYTTFAQICSLEESVITAES